MVDGSIVYHESLLQTKGRIQEPDLTSGWQQLGRMFRTITLPVSPIIQDRDAPHGLPGHYEGW